MRAHLPLATLVALAGNACASAPERSEDAVALPASSTSDAPALLAREVHFVESDDAADLLGGEDAFTRALSAFDRGFRLKADTPDVDDATYRAHLATTATAWSDEEREAYERALSSLDGALEGLALPLPERVRLVRTDGRDEFGAAYTRDDAIILPRRKALRAPERMVGLLAHELFHVVSRAGGDAFRDEVYALLGFERLPRPLEAPAGLEARRLTNPDAHAYAYAITVSTPHGPRRVVPVLGSRLPLPDAHQRPLGHVISLRLLAVDDSGAWMLSDSGAEVGYDVEETDYEARVSRNTDYIVHPEEVLADNFSLLVARRRGRADLDVADAPFLDRLEQALSH